MKDTYIQGLEFDVFTAACEPGWVITDVFNASYQEMNVWASGCQGCGVGTIPANLGTACMGKERCTVSANDGSVYTLDPFKYVYSGDPCYGSGKRVEFIFR